MFSSFKTVFSLVMFAQTAFAAPMNKMRRAVTALSANELGSLRPFTQLARAAYCEPQTVLDWTCGEACRELAGFEPTLAYGDGGDIQFFFIGFLPSENGGAVIVSHQGSDPLELEAILTDLRLNKLPLNQTLFPNTEGVEVHAGFRDAQEQIAPIILNEVTRLLAVKNVNKVITVGHSLGGALSEIDAVFLKLNLPDVDVSGVTFGGPRVGNAQFAALLDANIPNFKRVTNDRDLVPTIPGRFLGFEHAGDEIHLNGPGDAVRCSGADNDDDDQCIASIVSNIFVGNIIDHLGPYEGIFIGSIFCTD